MDQLRVIRRIDNLEIISKLMNSVAKRYGCRVKYNPENGEMCFYGDEDCQKYIVEETLSLFEAI